MMLPPISSLNLSVPPAELVYSAYCARNARRKMDILRAFVDDNADRTDPLSLSRLTVLVHTYTDILMELMGMYISYPQYATVTTGSLKKYVEWAHYIRRELFVRACHSTMDKMSVRFNLVDQRRVQDDPVAEEASFTKMSEFCSRMAHAVSTYERYVSILRRQKQDVGAMEKSCTKYATVLHEMRETLVQMRGGCTSDGGLSSTNPGSDSSSS